MSLVNFAKGILDGISALVALAKVPAKTALFLLLLSVFFLFCPDDWAVSLGLIGLRSTYRPAAGIVFTVSAIYLLCLCAFGILELVGLAIENVIDKRRAKIAVDHLDAAEIAVLREFTLQQRNTLPLPIDDPVVQGLMDKSILTFAGAQGRPGLKGMIFFPLTKSRAADQLVTDDVLGLLANGQRTEEQMQQIQLSRPDYVRPKH